MHRVQVMRPSNESHRPTANFPLVFQLASEMQLSDITQYYHAIDKQNHSGKRGRWRYWALAFSSNLPHVILICYVNVHCSVWLNKILSLSLKGREGGPAAQGRAQRQIRRLDLAE